MSYEDHIAVLLKSHRIAARYVNDPMKAEAAIDHRAVRIPKVTGDFTYLVAMHEVGHILTYDKRDGKLLREARAWKWAIANALPGISSAAWGLGFLSLNGYLVPRVNHQKQNIALKMGFTASDGPRGWYRIPPKSHWFWEVFNELDRLGA